MLRIGFIAVSSEDEFFKILPVELVRQMLLYIILIYNHLDERMLAAGVEGNVVQNGLHNSVKPACSDVFAAFVGAAGIMRNGGKRIVRKLQRNVIRFKQRRVLLCNRMLRLGKDSFVILLGEGRKLYADGKAPLQLRNEVGNLGNMKRPRRNEEDKIRLYRAIFRVYRAALHDREDIPLHALAGNIWA